MREYIKRYQRAGLMLFRRGSEADRARCDAIRAHNLDIAKRAFAGLMDGDFDYGWTRAGERMILYTRSTRGEFLQATYYWIVGGELKPTMHTDVKYTRDLYDTLIPGRYLNMAAMA